MKTFIERIERAIEPLSFSEKREVAEFLFQLARRLSGGPNPRGLGQFPPLPRARRMIRRWRN